MFLKPHANIALLKMINQCVIRKIKINMRTKIISAFPGTGKSFFHKKYPESSLDSDSSNFSWVKDENGNNTKERNPDFPQNYIEHIKSNIGKYEYIFVSSHKEVRSALLDSCIFFYLVFPSNDRKEEFIQRYRDRGNPESFIELIDTNWDNWINEMYWIEHGCEKITMVLENLEDELNHLNRVEVLDYDDGDDIEELLK